MEAYGVFVRISNRVPLLAMATGMDAISEILVNPNDVPRGRIPRGDFKMMLELQ